MAKPPEIIVATITPSSGPTGVQTHFNALLDYLHTQTLKPVLVTPRSYNKPFALCVFSVRPLLLLFNPSVNVWWFERGHYLFLKMALRKALKDAGPVVIYAQCPLSAKAALESRAGPEQRVVMAAHFNASTAEEWCGSLGLKRGGRVYRQIEARERQVLPMLDGLVYVSGFARDVIERAIPDARRVRSLVLPNFVAAVDHEAPGPITNDLITIGTLEARKNHAYLIRVLAEAKRLGRKYGLTLIGDGPLRSALEAFAQTLDVRDQLLFLGCRERARRFLPGHQVYVHSAVLESCPLVLIEAMASGLPVCAAPTGGISDVFENGREGFYWQLDDPAAGARTLITLREDPILSKLMSAAARRRFYEGFESSAIAGRLLDFLAAS